MRINREYYSLYVKDKETGKRYLCTYIWGDQRQGIDLNFENVENLSALGKISEITGNGMFHSQKEAWWHWYRFKDNHPEFDSERYIPSVEYYEV